MYMPDSLNHGKVVYKKQEKSRGLWGVVTGAVTGKHCESASSSGLDVLIYFWDERDGRFPSASCRSIQAAVFTMLSWSGPELCGWWFGPNVGGDQATRSTTAYAATQDVRLHCIAGVGLSPQPNGWHSTRLGVERAARRRH